MPREAPKFTPGPWSHCEQNDQADYCIWAPDGTFLANVGEGHPVKDLMADEPGAASRHPGPDGDTIAFDITALANAHLMATAPELFAWMEKCVDQELHLKGCGYWEPSNEEPSRSSTCTCGLFELLEKARGER